MNYMYILNDKDEPEQVNNPEVLANWVAKNPNRMVVGDEIVENTTRVVSGFTAVGLPEQLFVTMLIENDGRVHGIVFAKTLVELKENHARIVKEVKHVHMVAHSAGHN